MAGGGDHRRRRRPVRRAEAAADGVRAAVDCGRRPESARRMRAAPQRAWPRRRTLSAAATPGLAALALPAAAGAGAVAMPSLLRSLMFLLSSATRVAVFLGGALAGDLVLGGLALDGALGQRQLVGRGRGRPSFLRPGPGPCPRPGGRPAPMPVAGRPSARRRRNSLKSRLCAMMVWLGFAGGHQAGLLCGRHVQHGAGLQAVDVAADEGIGIGAQQGDQHLVERTLAGLFAAAILPARVAGFHGDLLAVARGRLGLGGFGCRRSGLRAAGRGSAVRRAARAAGAGGGRLRLVRRRGAAEPAPRAAARSGAGSAGRTASCSRARCGPRTSWLPGSGRRRAR